MLDFVEQTCAGLKISRANTSQYALLNVAADPGNALLEPAAGLRQVNAADTSVAFLFAALDQATALQRIQETYQRRPLNPERLSELLLPHAFAQMTDISQWPPRRLRQAKCPEFTVHGLPQTSCNVCQTKTKAV